VKVVRSFDHPFCRGKDFNNRVCALSRLVGQPSVVTVSSRCVCCDGSCRGRRPAEAVVSWRCGRWHRARVVSTHCPPPSLCVGTVACWPFGVSARCVRADLYADAAWSVAAHARQIVSPSTRTRLGDSQLGRGRDFLVQPVLPLLPPSTWLLGPRWAVRSGGAATTLSAVPRGSPL
jgi:hypothetical protein